MKTLREMSNFITSHYNCLCILMEIGICCVIVQVLFYFIKYVVALDQFTRFVCSGNRVNSQHPLDSRIRIDFTVVSAFRDA